MLTSPAQASPAQVLEAMVVGGSRGIGAIVKRLAREGATVVFTYVSHADRAGALVASIESKGGRAIATPGCPGIRFRWPVGCLPVG